MKALAKPLRTFQREVVLLASLFDGQAGLITIPGLWMQPLPTAVQSYAIVRLHDAWARFCKELVLASARGGFTTLGGAYVPRSPRVGTRQSPLAALKAAYPANHPGRHALGPKWFYPHIAIDAARTLQIANFPAVSAGLGLSGHAVDELRACRNFLVHRNKISNDELDSLRARLELPRAVSAEQLANTVVTGGAPLFEVWWRDLLRRSTAAVQ